MGIAMDRRAFLKICAGFGLVMVASPLEPLALEVGKGPAYAMIIDLERCMGCEACVVACRLGGGSPRPGFNTRLRFVEAGLYPRVNRYFVPVQCNQCKEAPCIEACKIGAITTLPNGIVYTDWSLCDGSGDCVSACPFGVRNVDLEHGGRSFKCDFCLEFLEAGRLPLCVTTCPSRARLFGDLSNPQGEFARYLKGSYLFQLAGFKGLRGRLFYGGNEELARLAL